MRKTNTHERLLTIKEAAARLRVSEVSLRRWTDRGELPCLRIGGRRERRFREADIDAFAHHGSASQQLTAPVPDVLLQGLEVARGSHLCAFYDSPEGRDKLAIPFLLDGLISSDRCFLIAAATVRDELLGTLGARHSTLSDALSRGQLVCHAPTSEPPDTLEFFRTEFAAATREGCAGMRVLGDMASFTAAGAALADLMAFEAAFDRALAHKYPVVSLCQYDAREFSGVGIVRALEAHGDLYSYPLRYFLGA